jgi:hypothetical protein
MDVATVKTYSKRRKNSEVWGNPDNCSGFGLYILLYVHEISKMLNTGGIKQIIPTQKIEDGGTSTFAR